MHSSLELLPKKQEKKEGEMNDIISLVTKLNNEMKLLNVKSEVRQDTLDVTLSFWEKETENISMLRDDAYTSFNRQKLEETMEYAQKYLRMKGYTKGDFTQTKIGGFS